MGVSYKEAGRGVVRKKRVVVGWRRGCRGLDVFVSLAMLAWTMASEFVARASMVSTLALARRWVCRVPRRSDDCFVRSVLGSWEAWDHVVAC